MQSAEVESANLKFLKNKTLICSSAEVLPTILLQTEVVQGDYNLNFESSTLILLVSWTFSENPVTSGGLLHGL